ncbi:TetR/AcrR family transcriptional regulator [Gordonia sp. L191]|uniref:TetR/AcrR family transcriptional regulator n=1 Tax=Gordonia sp. L191 TaxID=2982699 RepID=UPI0024C02282|nr:TetR/AcrR family transcriptional regulator [Gordonia sp. L191]WHU47439.1 TetR/AcrR family transcriptional regulator [Gordonia sp. L191]
MAPTASRETYFETGLAVLSSAGYGALKLSEVCRRLGVTTGSFYHFFRNWADYTDQLLEFWFDSHTRVEVAEVLAQPDPATRLDSLLAYGLSLPYGAEGAIRIWGAIDPKVHAVVSAVDNRRYQLVHDVVSTILGDESAHRYASWAVFLMTGYEQTTLTRDVAVLEWAAQQLLESLRREAAIATGATRRR